MLMALSNWLFALPVECFTTGAVVVAVGIPSRALIDSASEGSCVRMAVGFSMIVFSLIYETTKATAMPTA